MSFVISSTEDTSVKNFLTDSLLLQFTPTGVIADNQILRLFITYIRFSANKRSFRRIKIIRNPGIAWGEVKTKKRELRRVDTLKFHPFRA